MALDYLASYYLQAGDFATAKQKAEQVKQQSAAISADVAHAVHRTKRA